jgi:hypothetical protein
MSREYEYELRNGDEIVATGHVTFDEAVVVGQRVAIGNREGIVEEIAPPLGARTARVLIQLFPAR